MALRPIFGDRWRNTETGDEWKVASLNPFVWQPDGNARGLDGTSDTPGLPGAPGERGSVGPYGRTLTKVASQSIASWRAVVVNGNDTFRLADPNNPTHRQRVVRIVAYGGSSGALLTAQTAGDVKDESGGFAINAPLFVGAGGNLVVTPSTTGWRQLVATAVSSSQIVVALGEASLIEVGTEFMLGEGGYSTPCPLDRAADFDAKGYVTPAANARAFAAMLSGSVPTGLPPRRGQFLLALEAMQPGSIQKLLDALPASPSDSINVAWFHTVGVAASGRLAGFAKQILQLCDGQAACAIATALTNIE